MKNTFYKLPLLCFFGGHFIGSVKYCLLPIYILALVAVFQHCSIKPAFAEIRDCRSEFEGCLFYGGGGISNSCINFLVPKFIDQNNFFKFSQHGISEYTGSGDIFFSSIPSDSKEMACKESDCRCKGGMCQCVNKELRQVITSLSFAFIGCLGMATIIRLYYFFA